MQQHSLPLETMKVFKYVFPAGLLTLAIWHVQGQSWTWNQTLSPSAQWTGIACSADGSKLAAVYYGANSRPGSVSGSIYTSTNSGQTWVSNNAPSVAWSAVASSADGNKLVAT